MEVIVDLPSLKKAIDNVSKFVGETHLRIGDGLLLIQEMSSDSAAGYEATIKDIDVVGDDNFELFINALHFNKVLKSLGKVNKAILVYENNQLTVKSPNNKKQFTMPIYSDYKNERKLPNLNPSVKGKLSSAKLADVVVSAQATNKDIMAMLFLVGDGKLTVSSKMDNYKYEEVVEEYQHTEGSGRASYGVGWLKSISDCLIDDDVQLMFDTDTPLVITDNGADKISQRFILAPRINVE